MRSRLRDTLSVTIVMAFLAVAGSAAAIDLTASGTWSETIDAGDLVSGAGSAPSSSYQSGSGQVILSISNTLSIDDNWRVDVRRSDTNWDSSLVLSLKRTGDGTGAGSVIGGGSYQAVGVSDSAFFSGAGDRTDIPIQLQVSGMSLSVSPNTYSTSIILTVADI